MPSIGTLLALRGALCPPLNTAHPLGTKLRRLSLSPPAVKSVRPQSRRARVDMWAECHGASTQPLTGP